MKKLLRIPLLLVTMLLSSIPISAHDFEVDGIYYEITSSTAKIVSVTYRGSSWISYSGEYSGKITIPETVTYSGITYSITSIGGNAFYGCTGLTEVAIPNSVTDIGYSAFEGCTGLTSVAIPSSVTLIGGYAFYGCTGLTSVAIPSSVTLIGGYAFDRTPWYDNQPDGLVYINKVLYAYKGIMPENTSIEIADGTISISEYAFKGCTGLTSVTIPNSVTGIYSYAFYGCTGLIEIKVNAGNLVYDSRESCNAIIETASNTLIVGCKNTIIPNSVTDIGYSAFEGCTGLISIIIPNSVTYIGECAFRGCTGLISIAIPNSVTDIGYSAFEGCTGLTSITIPNSMTYIDDWFRGCTGLTSITIPNSVTEIGSYAFSGCTGLTSITIPNSVVTIGDDVFVDCTSLKEVIIEDGNEPLSVGGGIIDEYFGSYKGLFRDIPLKTLYLGRNIYDNRGCPPFKYQKELQSIIISNYVTEIGNYAFYGCVSLTEIAIPVSVISIGEDAFGGCTKLVIPKIINATQTTVTVELTSSSNCSPYLLCKEKKYKNGDKITDLEPGSYHYYDYGLEINGNYCQINTDYLNFWTSDIYLYLNGIANATSIVANGTYSIGDATFVSEGMNVGSAVSDFNNKNVVTFSNLDPNTSYNVYYSLNIKERANPYIVSKTFTTEGLDWSDGSFTATSTTSARLSVETNCDATMGTGYEWKRYDAPESLAPNKAPCPVVDGMLIGSLRNLNSEAYYKCRPYYTSSSGTTYYGEWVTFFTGDANVYFEPEVRTFSECSIVNNSVTVKGYALPGTDDISEQGFEYWKVANSRAGSTIMTVKASGISMTATLANLEYNSTYRYRAYVKTSQGVFYGDEMEFATGEDPAGIGYVEVDSNDFDVMLRENPATATAWIKVAGASAVEAEYCILTTNGGVVARGFIPADGDYQPIELNIAPGLYLMSVTDGSHRKTMRLIVR